MREAYHNESAIVLYALVSIILISTVAWTDCGMANEKLGVKDVLERSSSMELHDVMIVGTVRQLERLPPHKFGKLGCSVFGSVKFVLEDETGSIQVTLMGPCNVTNHLVGFQDGDFVQVNGQVVVFGRFGMTDPFGLSGTVVSARRVNRFQ